MISKKYSIYTLILFLLSASYFFNLLGFGYMIGYLLFPVIFINSEFIKRSITIELVLILFFSITYGIFYYLYPNSSVQFTIMYFLFPSTFFMVGRYFSINSKKESHIFYLFFFFGFIFSIRALISILPIISQTGFVNTLEYGRNLPILWESSNGNTSATVISLYLMCNMCIPAILISISPKKNFLFFVSATIIYILSFLCILRIGSRTQIVLSLIVFTIGLFYLLPKQSFGNTVKLFLALAIIVFYIYTNVSFDLDAEWLSSYANRLEDAKNTAGAGGRDKIWAKSIQNLIEKPFGWNVSEFGFSHNLWLDTARVGGLLSFLLLIIITIRSFFQINFFLKVVKNNSLKIAIISYAIGFLLIFLAEPILQASISLFSLFCCFLGIINGSIALNNIKNSNE